MIYLSQETRLQMVYSEVAHTHFTKSHSTFLVLTFMKLRNAQQKYVQIPYTDFHTGSTINVQSVEFPPLK